MVNMKRRRWLALDAALLAGLPLTGTAARRDDVAGAYVVTNLVSNGYTPTPVTDANLKNGWGIARSATSPIWVADNGTGKSTLYSGTGAKQPPASPIVVSIPAPDGGQGAPTGIVFNGTADFSVTGPLGSGPARFIFSTEDGTIAGWSPAADPANAIQVAHDPTAIYKGLAIASAGGNFLYATDFHNAEVVVYDRSFAPVELDGDFTDPHLPRRYAPFGIQTIGGSIYVTYAKQDADAEDEIAGQGLGVVDEYDTSGHFIRRVASHGQLNAPWGLALAPADFPPFGNALIVGNFGDGRLNAYDVESGELLGPLRDATGKRIVIDGLWGIVFGNGNLALQQQANALVFAAGPNDEADGLFGRIDPA